MHDAEAAGVLPSRLGRCHWWVSSWELARALCFYVEAAGLALLDLSLTGPSTWNVHLVVG